MGKNLKTPVSVRLDDEELRLLDQAAAKVGGNKTKAIVQALQDFVGEEARDIPRELERIAMAVRQMTNPTATIVRTGKVPEGAFHKRKQR